MCRVGGVGIRLVGRERGTGIVGWSLRGVLSDVHDVGGVPTTATDAPAVTPGRTPTASPPSTTSCCCPHLGRTVAALAALGVRPRRERDGELGGQPIRQIFFRLGEVIVEVVGAPHTPGDGPSTLWG